LEFDGRHNDDQIPRSTNRTRLDPRARPPTERSTSAASIRSSSGTSRSASSTRRRSGVEAATLAIDTLKRLHRALDRLDVDALAEAQHAQNAMAAQRIVQNALFGADN
jgi:hypothetical protein